MNGIFTSFLDGSINKYPQIVRNSILSDSFDAGPKSDPLRALVSTLNFASMKESFCFIMANVLS